jgi:hypothetical protein
VSSTKAVALDRMAAITRVLRILFMICSSIKRFVLEELYGRAGVRRGELLPLIRVTYSHFPRLAVHRLG